MPEANAKLLSESAVYNASMEFDPVDMHIASTTVQEVRRLVDGIDKYPNIDLFKEHP